MHQRSSLQGQDKPKRPRRTVVPKHIPKKDREKTPTKKEVLEETSDNHQVKIPTYLNLLLNLFYFPVAFVCKVYIVLSFLISLPSRIKKGIQYLLTLPWLFVDKASRVPAKLIEWTCRNLEGLLQLCIDYQVGGILCVALLFWLWPLPDMTYPLFAILRLVLGTLYPAYASFKAVRTKNVREYVSVIFRISIRILRDLKVYLSFKICFQKHYDEC